LSGVVVRTRFWFDRGGLDAALFYTSLIADSHVASGAAADGSEPMLVEFTLAGVPYMILNGGPHYSLTPATSIVITTDSQSETNRLWDALTADGGAAGRCGWLVDRWGVSWQIVPRELPALLSASDSVAAERARLAMFAMDKIDIAAVAAAFAGGQTRLIA
jgi:predicted 3-demethylubiquinone-9 3-methyltransferase (glyoxalase superfamily)